MGTGFWFSADQQHDQVPWGSSSPGWLKKLKVMNTIWNVYPEITPEEIMSYAVQQGDITMLQYQMWLMTDRTMEDVKEIIRNNIMDSLMT